ncbi:alpha/beta-Hydrolases superfamily protein [Perilla frutescens var. hirtella]|uniref:Alpha/beta-Hydrolases superfamily protein n=1 Tax=Perilla frutescens var. hirtella TaxID=608512 RepID=A0AAD4IXH6_PERFH|nr:alpha/beta-Hydrolases superfamily protein [Perilla frutescens var. hirtella]KAH6823237.1 alpha/beta-Hydrolases superfamily protein [Perilla frutescens var. hirtella]
MPSVTVKLYSVLFKFFLKRKLQTLIESPAGNPYGIVSRPDEAVAAANPSFSDDGVATKDLHIDPLTALSLRIFLPDSAVVSPKSIPNLRVRVPSSRILKKAPDGAVVYGGYLPENSGRNCRKLPVILHFHGGGWISGGSDTVANDVFCRRLARSCDAVVVAVGYRLAPESRFPAAFEDGVKVLNWLAKQANLAECGRSLGNRRGGGGGGGGGDGRRMQIVDGFGASMVEPWLAAHADLSRCVILGVSCGANIGNYVAQYSVKAGKLLDPVRVVAQVLMYPFFIGSIPTPSEIKLSNSYLYDKAMSLLAWKLFLPEADFNLDHPAANPLNPARELPLKYMPPTLTIIAEHDWMRDRAISYAEELRKVKIDAPVLDYKDAIHEFATLDALLKTPQAQACCEDIAIWMKKYISLRGNELSY